MREEAFMYSILDKKVITSDELRQLYNKIELSKETDKLDSVEYMLNLGWDKFLSITVTDESIYKDEILKEHLKENILKTPRDTFSFVKISKDNRWVFL